MATSVLACLFFIFFLPCFSNSCTPTLPCNDSIEIKHPFYLQSDVTIDHNCLGYLPIECYNNMPFLLWVPNKPLPLESISYDTNFITVQDPYLSSSLKKSGCRNLYFNFSSPINLYLGMYHLLNTSLSSVRCDPPDHIQSLPKIFGKDYNLSYSSSLGEDDHKPTQNCSRPDNSLHPSFESIFSFKKDSSQLTLLSASYSHDLVAWPGCFANWIEVFDPEDGKGKETKQTTRVTILIATTVLGSIAILGAFLIFYLKLQSSKISAECISQSKDRPEGNIEMLLEKFESFAPKRYNYDEVKKITGLFQHRLGKGGFGTVYRGILQDGRLVAVKILHNFSCGREELLNEVLSIGRTSHVNIVSLLGFCIEGSKDALIYEYMPNGSLDNYIYYENPKAVLGWAKLYEITIGIARGLEYLHRGCNARIVHFDIKPQNILLDEDFNPKIADFGLAKLCPPKESILSMAEMRGTIGYIAPEVFSRCFGVVSAKSDVYSYGMMVLEMVGGRRNAKSSAENPSQVYFPHWLYDCLVKGSPIQLQACDVLSIEIEEIAKKMGMVGLWCTQTMPANRPSMNRIVEMLERSSDELEMPPKPYLCSPPHSTILSDTSDTLKFVLNSQSDSDCLIGANIL